MTTLIPDFQAGTEGLRNSVQLKSLATLKGQNFKGKNGIITYRVASCIIDEGKPHKTQKIASLKTIAHEMGNYDSSIN